MARVGEGGHLPTNAKLYARAIRSLGKEARRHGIPLRQIFARKAPETRLRRELRRRSVIDPDNSRQEC